MNEQQLRDRMAHLVADQPPMTHDSAHDLRRGRRRVALRRGGAVVGAAGLAAVVIAGVTALGAGPTQQGTSPAVSPGDAAILERCTHTEDGALDPQTFGAGSRVLTSATGADGDVSAVVLSADGQSWGSCQLLGGSNTEFSGTAATYAVEPPQQGAIETNSMSLGRGSFSYVDRFPADVARVELAFPHGPTLSADTVDGFVVFEEHVTTDQLPDITLYGAGGEVLADESTAPGDASLPVAYRSLVPRWSQDAAGTESPLLNHLDSSCRDAAPAAGFVGTTDGRLVLASGQYGIGAAYESADGSRWAACTLTQEGVATVAVHPTDVAGEPRQPVAAPTISCAGGGDLTGCEEFVLSYVDRLPRTIGEVALLIGGDTYVAAMDEGYATYSGIVTGDELPAVDRVVLFDHHGTQLGEAPGPGGDGPTTLPEQYWSLSPVE